MIITKERIICICLVFLFSVGAPLGGEDAQGDLNVKMLMEDTVLPEIARLAISSENGNLKRAISITMERFHSGDIVVQVEQDDESSIFGSLSTTCDFSGDTPCVLSVDTSYARHYREHPSLAKSVLVHNLANLDFFFEHNRLFQIAKTNVVESYMFRMDAYHLEALFIRDILKEHEELTPFEINLINSFKRNNLRYFSYAGLGVDARLFYDNHNRANTMEFQAYVDYLMGLGRYFIDVVSDLSSFSDEDKYQRLIAAKTYVSYTPQMLYDTRYNKIGPWGDISFDDEYPELREIRGKLKEALEQNSSFMNTYGQKKLNDFFNVVLH